MKLNRSTILVSLNFSTSGGEWDVQTTTVAPCVKHVVYRVMTQMVITNVHPMEQRYACLPGYTDIHLNCSTGTGVMRVEV